MAREPKQYRVSDLLIWRRKVRNARHGFLPPLNSRSNPLVHADLVISSVFSPGTVVAMDRDDGRLRWKFCLDKYAGASALALGDRLLVKSSRAVYCLDSSTGKLIWEFEPYRKDGEWIYSSPIGYGKRVFIGDRRGSLHCLETRSGRVLWSKKLSRAKNNELNGTPRIHGGQLIVPTNARSIVSVNPTTREVLWRSSIDAPCIHEVQLFRRQLVVHTSRTLYQLSPSDGSIVKSWQWKGRQIRSAVVTGRHITVVHGLPATAENIESRRIDLRTTAVTTNSTLHEASCSEFFFGMRQDASTGLLYMASYDGLAIVDPATGVHLHHINFMPRTFTLPAVSNGVLFVLDDGGNVYALRHP